MPSSSKKQHNLMAMVANDPAAAKRLGISQKVGKDFVKADKGQKFQEGGDTMAMPPKSNKGGAMRGLERAAAMSGRTMPTMPAKRPAAPAPALPAMKKGGKVKKYAMGGAMPPAGMPAQANFGGATRGLDQAAAMSGRTMPTTGGLPPTPALPGGPAQTIPTAAAMTPTMKKGGAVKKFSAGGFTRAADGIAKKGKTRGKYI